MINHTIWSFGNSDKWQQNSIFQCATGSIEDFGYVLTSLKLLKKL